MQTQLATAWEGLFPGAQTFPEATEVGNRILKHLDICKFTLIHLCISAGWQMCVIHGVMFFRRLHLLDAPGCLDSIGTYSLSMFYLHNKVMNDRAATARRVGSKDCNLSWVSCKSEKGMRVRDWESDHVQKVTEGKLHDVEFLVVWQKFSALGFKAPGSMSAAFGCSLVSCSPT